MFYHNINPVLLKLGPFEIRYYGLFFVLGFVIAYFMLNYLAKKKKIELTKDDVSDYLLYLIIGTVAGARIFYVLIYNLKFYLANPLQIFAVWQGGLSFHGGLIGAVLAVIIFTKKRKFDFYELADLTVIPLALGLALGRIGNFTNGELFGRITNVPWAFKFSDAEGFRHPSQIYASLKNLLNFAVLWNLKNFKLPKGFLFWFFVTFYAFLRFIVEFFRQPDPQLGFFFGFLSMGQILSIIMFPIGLYFLFRIYNNSKKQVVI
jgi:phosphatidylglycerol:prolipoprotein diacylglycerol transferase|tara:strand:+ start:161 stop:946 length:786 start_codon:yes stop_codon:yes gene_type:complete